MQRLTRPLPRLMLVALLALLLAPLAGRDHATAAPAAQAGSGLPTSRVPNPQQPGVQWFAATGHTLRGAFLKYWQQYGGLAQFGYPITEEFAEVNPKTEQPSFMVQYFERARFEHHPDLAGTGNEVQLGLLGVNFHTPDPAVPELSNMASDYFKETGHNLSGPFRVYWHQHGGLFVNGYPISEAFQEVNPIDGKTYLVQYFQRARFEYHPENQPPYDVLLGLLGTQMARQMGYFGNSGAGAYPRFGHAADFSWIAGQVSITRIQGGCVFLNYGDNTNVQPIGDGWAAAQNAGLVQQGQFVVVFGHMAGPNEPRPMCPSPAYVIDRAMANTNPGP
jgi:hypothetical protein